MVFKKISDEHPGSNFEDTVQETHLPGGIGLGLWYISWGSIRKW